MLIIVLQKFTIVIYFGIKQKSIVPMNTPANFGEHPIGTGPWRFVEWRHDDYLRFARNTAYHDGAPLADTLETRIIPEMSTAEAEFEGGNVDIFRVPSQELSTWRCNDENAQRCSRTRRRCA